MIRPLVALLAFAVLPVASALATDFNGDGFADVAISSEEGDHVYVFFGAANGLDAEHPLTLSAADFGFTESSVGFGLSLAAGDFNGDGVDDLAIGAPLATVSDHERAGSVVIVPGSGAGGMNLAGATIWNRDTPGVKKKTTESDGFAFEQFGTELATGDFDDDGFDDLVISMTHNTGDPEFSGGFHVLRGSKHGITDEDDQFFTENTKGVKSVAQPFDDFGRFLRTGDVDGDGFDDLAVCSPQKIAADGPAKGTMSLFFGSDDGLSADKDRFLTALELGDGVQQGVMSYSAANTFEIADFNGDGSRELIVGMAEVAGESGQIDVLHVKKNKKVDFDGITALTQHDVIPNKAPEAIAAFGAALASGDFDGDGFVDLAIGAPYETIGPATNCGTVQVLRGSANGFITPGTSIDQDTQGVPDQNEFVDQFGLALSAGDFNDDGFCDLLIATPFEGLTPDTETFDQAGAVTVLYGSSTGLTTSNAQFFGEPGGPVAFTFFGWHLTH